MNILLFDNAAMISKEGNHYTNTLNGLFLSELIDLGNEISYIQFATRQTDNISVYGLELHGVRCVELHSEGNKIVRYLRAIPRLIHEISAADFVYLYYPNSFRWVSLLCKLFNKPYGLYIRGMIGIRNRISYTIYKSAYTVFTVSEDFTRMVNKVAGRDLATTIRPMIPYTDQDIVANRNYCSKLHYSILFLGRIDREKGLIELIQAVAKLHASGFSFELHIVGNGDFMNELKQAVNASKSSDYVYLDGPVYDEEAKASYYKNADIYILPTYHEGFPRTLYEAMIFGTPIITTFVGGIPALMKANENCERIEPRSVDSIVDVLAKAMNNYEEMGRLAKKATEMVTRIVDHRRSTHAHQLYDRIKNYGK